jgi:hypothetical protein
MYLVALTKESGAYFQRLHALDITTGAERAGSPVTITATASGTAPDAVNGIVTFNSKMQKQRVGLALTNGIVVIAWGSHDDILPYHGWVMGYDATTLAQVGVFCTTPDYYYGGIWQAGRAPAIDSAGNVYFGTGNAIWDGVRNWGDSILKFSVSRSGISILDWFTPSDWSYLNTADLDLGSSGVTILPNTNTLMVGGKASVFYLLNANNMGHQLGNDTQIIQRLPLSSGHIHGGPAYWNSATTGPLLYNWAENGVLRAYHFNGTILDTAYAAGSDSSPGHPGGALTVSANSNISGTGIVWANIMTSQTADAGFVAGILRAYNAETLQEIWDTERNPTRDRLGRYMRFVPPSVVNGKVYIPNYDNAVFVYGLLPTTPYFALSATPLRQTVALSRTASYTVNVSAMNGFAGVVSLSVAGVPSGATATFNPPSVTAPGTATLQIIPGGGTPIGNYSLTITGTSGGLSNSTPVTLSITPNPGNLVDAQAFGDQGTPSTTVTTNSFSTTTGGELLLAFIATDAPSGPNTTVTSVSGGGLTWSPVIRTNAQSGTSEIWRTLAASPLSNVSVTASLSAGVASSIAVMSFNNVDTSGTNGSGAIGAVMSASASSGAPTATLTTTRNNSLVLGVGNDFDNAIARTPGSNQTVFHQYLAPIGDTYWMQMQNSTTPLSGTSVTINDTAPTYDRYNLSIVEVLPATVVVPTYKISGTITPLPNGSGVTVTLTPGGAVATSDSSGNYSFSGLANGTYTVTPSKGGFTFTPPNRTVSVNGANVPGINFTLQTATASSVAVDAVAPGNNPSPQSTVTSAVFTTKASNELLLTFVATDYVSGSNTTVTSVAGAGLSWVLVVRSNTQSGTSEIWRAFAPSPLTNVSVTATVSQTVVSSIVVMSFTGIDTSGTNGSGAIGAFASGNANPGAPTAQLVTTRNNSLVVGVGNDYDNAILRTPGSGQTVVYQYLAPVGDTYWVQRQNAPTPLSGASVTINDTAPTGDRYNLAICEVLAAP